VKTRDAHRPFFIGEGRIGRLIVSIDHGRPIESGTILPRMMIGISRHRFMPPSSMMTISPHRGSQILTNSGDVD
jgi:hypothetical protein